MYKSWEMNELSRNGIANLLIMYILWSCQTPAVGYPSYIRHPEPWADPQTITLGSNQSVRVLQIPVEGGKPEVVLVLDYISTYREDPLLSPNELNQWWLFLRLNTSKKINTIQIATHKWLHKGLDYLLDLHHRQYSFFNTPGYGNHPKGPVRSIPTAEIWYNTKTMSTYALCCQCTD